MMRGKILLVIALYLILGVIAFFNFGFHGYLSRLPGWKASPQEASWKKLSKDVKNIRSVVIEEPKVPLSDQEEDE